eukprot:1840315-Pleurochrysis_carterae.AAC.2
MPVFTPVPRASITADAPASLAHGRFDGCASCTEANAVRHPHTAVRYQPFYPGRLIHADIVGPLVRTQHTGYQYLLVLVDDHTRFKAVNFLKQKSEAPAHVRRFLASFNALLNKHSSELRRAVGSLHSDKAGEFFSHEFTEFVAARGVNNATCPPHLTRSSLAASEDDTGWASRLHAAYPPDFNFFVARAIGLFHASRKPASDALDTTHTAVASAVPEQPREPHVPQIAPDLPPATPANQRGGAPADESGHQPRSRFQRALGDYPLRSRAPAALLAVRSRRDKPAWGRSTGCAFAMSNVSADPRLRKQAMAEDRIGWGAAERAEIANHNTVCNQYH